MAVAHGKPQPSRETNLGQRERKCQVTIVDYVKTYGENKYIP